jgi:hypothetical protein
MQIECPECKEFNVVEINHGYNGYTLEYRCKCGYYCSHTDPNYQEAFKGFSDEIFKSKKEDKK